MLSDMYQELAVTEQRRAAAAPSPAQGRRWWSDGWRRKKGEKKKTYVEVVPTQLLQTQFTALHLEINQSMNDGDSGWRL